ncbi:unnamed protein product [Victoria cruziana]
MGSRKTKKNKHAWKLHRRVKWHNKKEMAERVKINQQIKALRAVLPNNRKRDTISVLRAAIDYLKFIQSQIHAMVMSCSLQNGASTVGLQRLENHQLGLKGPLEVPMALLTKQGVCSVNGSKGMGCCSCLQLLDSSTAHHELSRASNLTRLPCQYCSMLTDARACPQPLNPLVPDQEADAEEDATTTSDASTTSRPPSG